MSGYIAVAGGVNIDIGGRSLMPLVSRDSNPGTIQSSLGGVGRNIAHNLALLGVPVKLISALGTDSAAAQVESSCRELGIDLSFSLHISGKRTGTYLYIDGPDGDMALALNDMDILNSLTPEYFSSILDVLCGAELVILDANLPLESIVFIARNCTAPLFGDPVSIVKAERFLPVLGHFHTLKPNRMEAELLSGMRIDSNSDLVIAAEHLLSSGVQQVFLSLGANGVFAADRQQQVWLECPSTQVVNTTGCGDAFTAALAFAFLNRFDLVETTRTGLAAASITSESYSAVHPGMCKDIIKTRMEIF